MLRFFSVLLCALILSVAQWASLPAAYGQSANTGALSGEITDPSGRVVAGAQIQVVNETTGERRTLTSDANGVYRVPQLPPGNYRVEVSKENFKTSVLGPVTVGVTETATLKVRLELGTVTEKVEVVAQAEALQTESSALGEVTNGEAIRRLPLAVRNYTQIVALNAGVSADVTRADDLGRGNGGYSGGGSFSANGSSTSDNNYQIDGMGANDRQGSGSDSSGAAIPNPDTIQEFKVQTAQYDATYGRNAGASVNLVTKGGSSEFHGDVWEYFRNTALNANDYFLNSHHQPRAVLNQNQFGFDLGGPIKRERLLFFTSYQGTRQRNGLDQNCKSSIQEPKGLTNDRSEPGLALAFAGQNGSAGSQAADTIQSYAGPGTTNIRSQALALLQIKLPNGQYLIPTPQNLDGSSVFSIACPFNEDQFNTNADYLQSDRSKFSVRFFFANSDLTDMLPVGRTAATLPGTPSVQVAKYRNFSLTHNYVFSPRVINQAAIGFHRTYNTSSTSVPFTYSDIGSTVPSFDVTNPIITIGQQSAFGINGAPGSSKHGVEGQNTFEGQDMVSYQVGSKHFLRFGGGVSYAQNNRMLTPGDSIGFNTIPDFLLGRSGSENGSASPFSPGLSNIALSVDTPALAGGELRNWDGNAFIQDDLKVTSRLTVNLGFRYDHEGYLADKLGRNVGFDPSLITPYSTPCTTYQGGCLVGYLVPSNYRGTVPTGVTRGNNEYGFLGKRQNTWNPRLGFAWRLPHSERFVLRGGWGIYDSVTTGQQQLAMTLGQPFSHPRFLLQSANAQASWAEPFQPFDITTLPSFTPYMATTDPFLLQGVTAFDPNYRTPFIQQYSLGIQTELTRGLVLEIGYSGSRGVHLADQGNSNQPGLATASFSPRGATTNEYANYQQRVPYEGFIANQISLMQSNASSWYNALLVRFSKQLTRGLQFQVSYTYSKNLQTYADSSLGDANHPPYGAGGRPQRFVANYTYQLPGPKDVHSFAGKLLRGWQLAGVTTYQAGDRLTITAPTPYSVYGKQYSFASLAQNCTMSQLATGGPVQARLSSYLNENCVTYPAVVGGVEPSLYPGFCPNGASSCAFAVGIGNLGTGVVRGPDQANWDLSISRQFPVRLWREGTNVEFKSEFFNVFNHAQFADPNTSLIQPGIPPPVAQALGLDTYGHITSTSVNPRIIQFALRFNF